MGSEDKKKGWVNFEIEEDADELFRQALDNIDPDFKKEDEEDRIQPARKPPKSQEILAIDLHRKTLEEAKATLQHQLGPQLAAAHGELTVKIITGKGVHSGRGGSVLPGGVHRYVKEAWGHMIADIEPAPDETLVRGLPLRGHFTVKFRW